MKLVSVIITTFNSEKYIRKTIESVQSQSYSKIEIIVVDDFSSDSTCRIIKDISLSDPRVKLIELSKNHGGPAGPRNIGVSNATGQWICFLDADDLWHSSKLSIQLDVLEKTGKFFCCTKKRIFNEHKEFNCDEQLSNKKTNFYLNFRQQCSKNRIPTSSVLISSSLLKLIPFNESPDYHAVEDMQCWLKILESGQKCIFINLPLVGYRINENQISRNKLVMAKKFYMVINNYKLKSGDGFGWKKYLYFLEYCFYSILFVLINKFS